MLDNEVVQKIQDFVAQCPRSINEIAEHIGKSWRTVDRYVDEIRHEFGTLETKTFRGGTRGALKVVYLTPSNNFSGTIFQDELEKEIFRGRKKEDMSSFDIYQFVDDSKKSVWTKMGVSESSAGRLIDFKELLDQAKKQVLFFSGNLSFINFQDKTADIFETIEGLVARGISVKVVCRVDFAGIENIKRLLSLNYKYDRNLVEIKHREQPLRVTIIDDKIANMKDLREPTKRINELKKKLFVFYTIYDREWIQWLTRIFWNMFNKSISAEKRLTELEKIKV